jgi:hypothetical protein
MAEEFTNGPRKAVFFALIHCLDWNLTRQTQINELCAPWSQIVFHSCLIDFYFILFLYIQVSQLKNIIAKLTGQESSSGKSSKKNPRPFDMALYKKRHVLLQIAYFGWDFCGFAVQVKTQFVWHPWNYVIVRIRGYYDRTNFLPPKRLLLFVWHPWNSVITNSRLWRRIIAVNSCLQMITSVQYIFKVVKSKTENERYLGAIQTIRDTCLAYFRAP